MADAPSVAQTVGSILTLGGYLALLLSGCSVPLPLTLLAVSVLGRILGRAEHALAGLPTHDNPYLEYILTGNFARALPPYLERDRIERVRAGLDRLTLFEGPAQEAPGEFDGFNLSDIFEYMPPDLAESVYGRLLDKARPGARLAYWNMLAPRSCPEKYQPRVKALDEPGARLLKQDRAFFYRRFVVEEVRGLSSSRY